MSIKHQYLREKIYQYVQKLQQRKLIVGSWGNVSIRIPEEALVVICPNGEISSDFKKEDIGIFDMEGNLIDGSIMPIGKWRMHLELYKANPNINSIIVSNAPHVQSFAIANKNIPDCCFDQRHIIGGEIPCIELEHFNDAGKIFKYIETTKAILIKEYGIICYDEDIKSAFEVTALSERTAKSYIFSKVLQ